MASSADDFPGVPQWMVNHARWRTHWMTHPAPKPLNYYLWMSGEHVCNLFVYLFWGAALLGWFVLPVDPVVLVGWYLVILGVWKGISLCITGLCALGRVAGLDDEPPPVSR